MKDMKHGAREMKADSKSKGESNSHGWSGSQNKEHGGKTQGHDDRKKKGY